MKKYIYTLCIVAIIIFSVIYISNKDKSYSIDITDALDTVSTITIISNSNADKILQECKSRITEFDNMLSVTKENSDISKINNNAGNGENISVNPKTIDMLQKSITLGKSTNGSLDITVGNLVNTWDTASKTKILPSNEEISNALSLTNYEDIIIDTKTNTARLNNIGEKITLGAIAKGYIADDLVSLLKSYGIKSALINLGGNTYAMGKRLDTRQWNVGIQDPLNPSDIIGSIPTMDKCVITSGDYQRYFELDGNKYHHIINPHTGYPSNSGVHSVTIIGNDSTIGDGLSTAFFVLGVENSLPLIKQYEIDAVFVTTDKKIYITQNIWNDFNKSNSNYEYIKL